MRHVKLINAAEIIPQAIDWLWKGWIALGKFHLLAGPPGTGKTTILLAIAAVLSAGGTWPCGLGAKRAKIVIWSGEDSPEDTLVPRLLALGANMSNIAFVGDVQERSSIRTFDPARDMDLLFKAIDELDDVGLLILDPVVSCVDGDSHKNSEVRRALQPIIDLGIKMNMGIVGNTHLNKAGGETRSTAYSD
jgi:putative DNA primase/helicase